jgi:hypothetical protein
MFFFYIFVEFKFSGHLTAYKKLLTPYNTFSKLFYSSYSKILQKKKRAFETLGAIADLIIIKKI